MISAKKTEIQEWSTSTAFEAQANKVDESDGAGDEEGTESPKAETVVEASASEAKPVATSTNKKSEECLKAELNFLY